MKKFFERFMYVLGYVPISIYEEAISARKKQPLVIDLTSMVGAMSHNRKTHFRNDDFHISHCPDCGENMISVTFTKEIPESAKVILETMHGINEVITLPEEPKSCHIVKEDKEPLDKIIPAIVDKIKTLV